MPKDSREDCRRIAEEIIDKLETSDVSDGKGFANWDFIIHQIEIALQAAEAEGYDRRTKESNSGRTMYQNGYAEGIRKALEAAIQVNGGYGNSKDFNEGWDACRNAIEVATLPESRDWKCDNCPKEGYCKGCEKLLKDNPPLPDSRDNGK